MIFLFFFKGLFPSFKHHSGQKIPKSLIFPSLKNSQTFEKSNFREFFFQIFETFLGYFCLLCSVYVKYLVGSKDFSRLLTNAQFISPFHTNCTTTSDRLISVSSFSDFIFWWDSKSCSPSTKTCSLKLMTNNLWSQSKL